MLAPKLKKPKAEPVTSAAARSTVREDVPKVGRGAGETLSQPVAWNFSRIPIYPADPIGGSPPPTTATAVVQEVLRAPGTSLDAATRSYFEPSFGFDFSRVRVHAGPLAAAAAQSVRARAFTVGRDIVFAADRFAPGTREGQRLLAHELTHVVQQTMVPNGAASAADAEVEAARAGTAYLAGLRPAIRLGVVAGAIQREPDGAAQSGDPSLEPALRAAANARAAGDDPTKLTIAGAQIVYRIVQAFLPTYADHISGVGYQVSVRGVKAQWSGGSFNISVGKDFILGMNDPTRAALDIKAALSKAVGAQPVPRTGHGLVGQMMQQQPTAAASPQAPPRHDYVFIMGADPKGTGNPFYTLAARYFRAHLPAAKMVEDQRSLTDLLNWIATNVNAPIGDLYIVSHGNEDGTLAFGLDAADKDAHLSVVELRKALHPSGGGASALGSVAGVVDSQTRIHIKGCDIGRTQEMVELIDEAFGGAGTVTAPTQEQDYGTDPTLGAQASATQHDAMLAAFSASLPPLPPMPAPIDKKLKGAARKQAEKEHAAAAAARAKAEAARKKAVVENEKRIRPELAATAEKAATVESLSGPMFQRPGTKLFTEAELRPKIDQLYGHLPEDRRKQLAARLTAPDSGGPHDQRGQRVDRITPYHETFGEPATLGEAKRLFAKEFKDKDFTPSAWTPTATGASLTMTFTGTKHPRGADPSDATMTFSQDIPTDAAIIEEGKAITNNPDRYAWRVERTHDNKSGKTKLTAVGERVMAYLHHGSLDRAQHDHFTRLESNPDFYATSTFTPPPAVKGTPTP
jgi:hypothetical protein